MHIGWNSTDVFTDRTSDLRPSNAARQTIMYSFGSRILPFGGNRLAVRQDVHLAHDKNSPRMAVVKQEFARGIFGSVHNGLDGYSIRPDGTRIQVVGVVEDGKYTANIAEIPQMTMFPSFNRPRTKGSGYCNRVGFV